MAQILKLVDDIDGSTEDVETVTYEVDGTEYKIDLNKENREELEDRLTKLMETKDAYSDAVSNVWDFTQHATKARPSSASRKRNSAVYGGYTTQQIREWAKEQGIEVNAKGKLPDELVEKHKAAHAE